MTETEALILEHLQALQADIHRLSGDLKNLQDSLREDRVQQLRRDIAQGIAEADKGLFVDGPAVLASIREHSAQRRSQ